MENSDINKLQKLIEEIRNLQSELTDDQRHDLWYEIMSGYCVNCGSMFLPCYCNNDD